MSSPAEELALVLPTPQSSFVLQRTQVPTKVTPSDLLVKIHSTALNPADWKIAKYGLFLTPKDYPAVIGLEAAGEVAELGAEVKGWAKGDRVVFNGALGGHYHGTFQQYAVVPSEIATKIPSNITDDEASTLPVSYSTGIISLYHPTAGAGLTPPWAPGGAGAYSGTPLLVLGGAGSVGKTVIQLAKLSGFSPIITTASRKHASELTSLGATLVVPRDDPLTSALLSTITSAPLSLAYDAVGIKATQQAAYDLLAPGGILLTVLPDSTEKGDERGRKVITFFGSPWPEPQRALGRDAYKALAGYLEQGLIKPSHVEVVPGGLAAIPGALKTIEEGKAGGIKLVVHPQENQ